MNKPSRFVVPLIDPTDAPKIARRLNPVFQIDGRDMVMYTQFASSIPAEELRERVGTLEDRLSDITNAHDSLIGIY